VKIAASLSANDVEKTEEFFKAVAPYLVQARPDRF
jgi:hypothetical protein